MKKYWYRFFVFSLVFTVFFFMAKSLYVQRNDLLQYEWCVNVVPLVFGTIIVLVSFVLLIGSWKILLNGMHIKLSFSRVSKIYVFSYVSRYLPGGVWHYVGRVHLLLKSGASFEAASASIFFEQMLSIIAGFFILVFLMIFWDAPFAENYKWIQWLLPVLLLVVYPPLMLGVFNCIARLLNRPEIKSSLGIKKIVIALLITTLAGILNIFSNYLVFLSLTNEVYIPLVGFLCIITLAQILGYLAIGVPGGIGVREGVVVVLLSNFMPTYIAVVYSLISRLWLILVDLALVAVVVSVNYYSSKQKNRLNQKNF